MSSDLLKEYLIHSYLYYACDDPIMYDHDFDAMCRTINKTWDDIESPYKEFIYEKEDGNIGGLKGLPLWKEDYPEEIVEEAADRLADYRSRLKGAY